MTVIFMKQSQNSNHLIQFGLELFPLKSLQSPYLAMDKQLISFDKSYPPPSYKQNVITAKSCYSKPLWDSDEFL
jgi:hypothetical protein